MKDTIKKYRSLESLAAGLGLPSSYLKHLVREKKIPYLLVGSRRRFQLDEVVTALNALAKGGENGSN